MTAVADGGQGDIRPGTCTVLFTDLVGSTTLRTALGEERADALRRVHDQLLGDEVARWRGIVVKGGGDGLMAAFGSASDAVAAAVAMQQAVAAHNRRPGRLADLSVRIGLSVGDVSWEDGDCFGTPVVEAARLEALAEGGQILCSDFVRIMARGRGDHDFELLGFRELKGLPEPVPTCLVRWTDRPAVAVPLHPVLARAPRFPFVGRADELAAAERALAASTGTRLLWVTGEPGAGKTRLVAELARRCYDNGWTVLFGHAEADVPVPYRPIVEALRTAYEASDASQLERRIGDDPAALASLVPEIERRLQRAGVEHNTGGPVPESEVSPYRLFEAVRAALAALAAEAPLLLVLDDVQWAGAPVFRLLAHLLAEHSGTGVAVAATCRDGEAPAELRVLVDDRDDDLVTVVRLDGLSAPAVAELVAASGEADPPDPQQLHRDTAGNPFYVTAVLRNRGGGAASATRRRLAQLDDRTTQALRVAALLGLEFELALVAELEDRDVLDVLDGFERALRTGVLHESGPGRFQFAHALVRDGLLGEWTVTRRAITHRRIAEALTRRVGAHDVHAAVIATHWLAAAAVEADAVLPAAQWAEHAGRQAMAEVAYDEAQRQFGLAADLRERLGGRDRAWAEVLLASSSAARSGGDLMAAMGHARAGYEAALATGDLQLAGECAYAWTYASFSLGAPSRLAFQALREVEGRLPANGTEDLRCRLLAASAMALTYVSRSAQARVTLDRALELAEHATATTWAIVCGAATMVARRPEEVALRQRIGRRVYELVRAGHDWDLMGAQLYHLGIAELEGEELDGALAAFAELDERARRSRDPMLLTFAESARSATALLGADLVGAEAAAERAAHWATRLGRVDTGTYGVQMFTIRREQGRLGEITPVLRLLARRDEQTAWRPGLALAYAETGLLDEAAQQLRAMVADDVRLADDARFALSCAYLAETAVAVGDRDAARVLRRTLAPYAPTSITLSGSACLGPATRVLGLLDALLGAPDDAEVALRDALARSEAMRSPLWTAHCHVALAHLGVGNAAEHAAAARSLARRHDLVRVRRLLAVTDLPSAGGA